MEDNRKQIFSIPAESELRVECKLNRFFYVSVVAGTGTCEIFGSEIGSSSSSTSSTVISTADKKRLGGGKWAFFSYKGCSIELETVSKSSKKSGGGDVSKEGVINEEDDADDDDDNGEESGEEEDKEEQAIEIAYISEETPMMSYLNVHGVLEAKRKKARECSAMSSSDDTAVHIDGDDQEEEDDDEKKKRKRKDVDDDGEEEKENDFRRSQSSLQSSAGPRVLIVGPSDVGKSSLSKILINYAARQAWSPLFIDLDLGQNAISVPGTISAAPIDHPINPFEEGSHVNSEMPLSYFFGDVTVTENSKEHYKFLVEKVAEMMEARNSKNDHARHSGCIVNTMGWIEGLGLELILHAVKSLKIDTVLCLGQERLFQTLSRQFAKDAALAQQQQQKKEKKKKSDGGGDDDGKKEGDKAPSPAVEILSLKKSGGVVERTTDFRRKTRDDRFREYFYGFDFLSNPLSPVAQSAFFSSVSFYKVGGGPKAPTSALPIGQEASTDPMRVAPVIPSMSLVNAIVAVSHGKTQSDLLTSNVAGFIHIVEVDMNAKRFTYLSPNPGHLPNTNLIVGNVKWFPEN